MSPDGQPRMNIDTRSVCMDNHSCTHKVNDGAIPLTPTYANGGGGDDDFSGGDSDSPARHHSYHRRSSSRRRHDGRHSDRLLVESA